MCPSGSRHLDFLDLTPEDRVEAARLAIDDPAVHHLRILVGAGVMRDEAVEIRDHLVRLEPIRLARRAQLYDAVSGRRPCVRHDLYSVVFSSVVAGWISGLTESHRK